MTAKSRKKVYIVGFAPSYSEVPWGTKGAEYWGLNALHRTLPSAPWSRWFQLHDLNVAHQGADLVDHLAWLQQTALPVYIFEQHAATYPDVPNLVFYPQEEAVVQFDSYFTNTISWMIALAIMEGFKEIALYGVDMAQSDEYANQRPSCEYMIGIAKGMGLQVEIATGSDLLRSSHLYGAENFAPMRQKMDTRSAELQAKRNALFDQLRAGEANLNQLDGALEDLNYWKRVWSAPEEAKK